jgi:IclR family pca regulon transcriptional regulator
MAGSTRDPASASNDSGVERKQSKPGPRQTPESPLAQLDAFRGDPDFMTSLARGLIVLQAFNQLKHPASISVLSGKTGLSRAAVRRCLYTLTRLGFTGSDEAQRFLLLPKALSLGYGYFSATPFAAGAQPVLDRCGQQFRESCSVSVLDGDEIVYIARAGVTRIMSIDLGVGSRLPAFCTSMGRVLLAHLPVKELEHYLRRVKLVKHTERTVTSVEKLRQILKTIRREGFAIVDQELEEGLRSIAVPVQTPGGRIAAALNAGAQAQRVTMDALRRDFLPHLQEAAKEIGMLF